MSREVPDRVDRAFRKSLEIIGDRLGVKIKHATLIIDTDFGSYEFYEQDSVENFQATVMAFFTRRLNAVIASNRHGTALLSCDMCQGKGEILISEADGLKDCPKCHGGGIMAVTTNLSGQNVQS